MGKFQGLLGVAGLLLPALYAAGCASSHLPTGGSLGICGKTVEDEETGKRLGVEVVGLDEHSPLRGLGVRRGDRIVSVDGEDPGTASDLVKRVYEAGCEKPLRLAVRSGDATRDVEVVPAGCRRYVRIGIGIPFLFRWDGDTVELFPLSLASIGPGPDAKGLTLLSCVGYMSRPDSADLSLGLLTTGTGYRLVPPEEEAPAEEPERAPKLAESSREPPAARSVPR